MRIERDLVERIENDLEQSGFPSLEWYDVLRALDRAEAGWLRQADVSRRVPLAVYNLSRLIDRLDEEGLARRQQVPRDGRNNVLMIATKGRDLRRQMGSVYAARCIITSASG